MTPTGAAASELADLLERSVTEPILLANRLWPDVFFYRKQREVIESLVRDDETFVPAGNMLGKDFVAAFAVLWFFLTRNPVRIVTTSAKDDHLRVLWGEIGNFLSTSAIPLDAKRGGPVLVNHQDLRKVVRGERDSLSYAVGMVASSESIAAMQGHHVANVGDGIPRTLFVSDESSSVPDEYKKMANTWANRQLVIGNTWPCSNFWYRGIKGKPGTRDRGGDRPDPYRPGRFYRKVIKVRATDSPNVALGLAEVRAGREPSDEVIVPGVKSYGQYRKDLETMDEIEVSVCLRAEFWEGADAFLFPSEWLARARRIASNLKLPFRKARAIGVDTGAGEANTAIAVVDEYGLLDLKSWKTPDTAVIGPEVIDFLRRYAVDPADVLFDSGGGGLQIADQLRREGYGVRTVGFGESPSLPVTNRRAALKKRKGLKETKTVYPNRRSEMYGDLRDLLDPVRARVPLLEPAPGRPAPEGFGLPEEYAVISDLLSPIPLTRDEEGRLVLPPKTKRDPRSKKVTLIELLGRSPDETDALALAVHAMLKPERPFIVEAF